MKNTTSSKLIAHHSRREFLRSCLRYPALAVLASTGILLIGRKHLFPEAEPCLVSQVCRNCSLFVDCEKPQAQKTRKAS